MFNIILRMNANYRLNVLKVIAVAEFFGELDPPGIGTI